MILLKAKKKRKRNYSGVENGEKSSFMILYHVMKMALLIVSDNPNEILPRFEKLNQTDTSTLEKKLEILLKRKKTLRQRIVNFMK